MRKPLDRLTYANVIATMALFLALGGGAYAATQLPKDSIGSQQIKQGSIQFNDLSKAAKRKLRGLAGAPGKTGAPGAAGPQGPAGATTTALPGGQTLRGVYAVAGEVEGAGDFAESSISFGATLAAAPRVEVVAHGAKGTATCPGTVQSPSAAPGTLCPYEEAHYIVSKFQVCANACSGGGLSAYPWGAELQITSQFGGYPRVTGTWAVTAP